MYEDLKKELQDAFHMHKKLRDLMPRTSELSELEFMILNQTYHLTQSGRQEEVRLSDFKLMNIVSKPAVSQALNALEEKGYLRRSISSGDRRAIALHITEEGKQVISKNNARLDEYLDLIIKQMGPEDMKTLATLFRRMIEIFIEINHNKKKEER